MPPTRLSHASLIPQTSFSSPQSHFFHTIVESVTPPTRRRLIHGASYHSYDLVTSHPGHALVTHYSRVTKSSVMPPSRFRHTPVSIPSRLEHFRNAYLTHPTRLRHESVLTYSHHSHDFFLPQSRLSRLCAASLMPSSRLFHFRSRLRHASFTPCSRFADSVRHALVTPYARVLRLAHDSHFSVPPVSRLINDSFTPPPHISHAFATFQSRYSAAMYRFVNFLFSPLVTFG
jgi:hypothetical protein